MRKSMRRWSGLAVVAAILIVAALLLGACGSSGDGSSASPSSDGAPKPGGTYNYPLSANPVSIEPLNAQESEGMQVAHQVFEGLTKHVVNDKGEMEVAPSIAESWESTDSQTWTFKLKQGVMFQAPVSREVVAQDFVDSWNRVTDPKNQSYVSYILSPVEGADDGGYQTDPKKGLTGVTAIDDYTLQVKLRYPFAEFATTLAHNVAAATPVEYIDKIGVKAYGQKPVGTGPYMVESWKNNQSVTLQKNPAYWDKAAGGPYIDTINMPIIPSSQTEWLEFQKGSTDYTTVPPGQVAAAEANPKVKSGEWTAKKWPNLGMYFIGINMTDATLGQNQDLRAAIAQSADAVNVINIVNEGVSLPAGGYVPVGIPGYVADQTPYKYDVAAATAKADAMGGAPELKYWYNTDEGHQKVAEVLQAGWQKASITVKLSNFEWGTFLDKLAKSNEGGGSQLFRMGWLADYPSMDNFLYPLFQSAMSKTMYTFYSNTQVDDLLQQARSTMDDQQRFSLYAQAEKMILTDMPAVPLYFYRDFRVTNNRIGGFIHNPMGFTDMWTVWVK